MDVAGEDDGECGPGFASPDQPDGGLVLELDDDWLREFLFLPQGLWLRAGCPDRSQGCGLGFVALPQAELWWVHVDVVLVAELDGEADLGLVQADEDEGGFGDGLGGPVGGDQPGKLVVGRGRCSGGLGVGRGSAWLRILRAGRGGCRRRYTGRGSSWQPLRR